MNTDWFTENIDSLFFEADTIRLIQHINYGPVWDKDDYAEDELEYLPHGHYLNFGFHRKGFFKYSATYYNYMTAVPVANFSWKFDRREQILTVYQGTGILFTLRPLATRHVEISSRYAGQKSLLTTNELTLIKIKQPQ